MAKVVNAPLGELSGKLGGVVYARNKSGPIVRANAKGINPRTGSQLASRGAFAYSSSLFRNITATNKVYWQEFADNYFNPKNGTNTGQYSGYNAFMGLRAITNVAGLNAKEAFISINGGASNQLEYDEFIPMPNKPIGKSFVGAYKDEVTEDVYPLTITEVNLADDGDFDFTLQVGDGSGVDIQSLEDPNGYHLGFGVYISYGSPMGSKNFKNADAQRLAYLKPVFDTSGATGLDVCEELKFTCYSLLDISDFKRFPLVGEEVFLNVYAINKYGQVSLIGGQAVEVDPA